MTDGQAVAAGTVLGIVGYDRTEKPTATPNHLHFELWDTSRGPKGSGNPRQDYGIDPEPAMASWSYRGKDGAHLVADGATRPPEGGIATLAIGAVIVKGVLIG